MATSTLKSFFESNVAQIAVANDTHGGAIRNTNVGANSNPADMQLSDRKHFCN